MNNIIYITGAPRCGKTTLAKKLANNNISILSLDSFSKSVRSVFKEFKLYSDSVCIQPDINREKFLELVSIYINNFAADFYNHKLLVEGCHFTPEEFKERFTDSKVICLGRTKSKVEIEKMIMNKSWMASLSKEIIDEYTEKIFNYSLALKENQKDYLYFETDEIDISKITDYLKYETEEKYYV